MFEMRARFKFAIPILIGLALTACVSASGPPAPIAEIPSVLTFPEDVSIDLSTIGGDGPKPVSEMIKSGATAEPDNFSDIISLGPLLIAATDQLLDDFLNPLQSLKIPVSPQIRNFEGIIDIPGIIPQRLKVDFSPYDFDGDGVPEGTGCTCPLGCTGTACPSEALSSELQPIAYRIWIQNFEGNFERFMAGIFDVIPIEDDPTTSDNEENPGKGQFRLVLENLSGSSPENTQNLAFGVVYNLKNFSDPLNLNTELFVQDREFSKSEPKVQIRFDNFHSIVAQEGVNRAGIPSSLQKTAKVSMQESPPVEGSLFDTQYIGSFLEDFDFWSGTFALTRLENGVPRTEGEENICARISTGEPSSRENCIDLGIDVAGENFLPPTLESDVTFPADFPLLPTF